MAALLNCAAMHCRLDEPQGFSFPTAKDHYAADRVVRPLHVRLEVSLDFDRHAVKGRCHTQLQSTRALREVTFDAVDLDVAQVTVDGRPATFRNDGRKLAVALPKAAKAGARLEVTVAWSCRPRRGLYFVGPDAEHPHRPVQAWTQGQDEDSRHWFPCLDAPAQKATTEVLATFPAHFTSLSNGRLVSEKVKGDRKTSHHRLDAPHSPYLVTLVVGEFEVHEDGSHDVVVRTLFPKGRKADALRSVARTSQMVRFFEDLTGRKYPWGDYAQVYVAEFIFGGMENTGATTLTDVSLFDARAALDHTAEPLISHELAHQWFGDLLTCRDWPHGWLNEGFATYAEVLWKEHADGPDEADQQRLLDLEEYLAEAKERYARPLVTRRFDAPIDVFDRHLYEKGALVLHELRRRLGDADFKAVLRAYVARHAGGAVETVDLARAVEEVTGRNLDAFFDRYVHREGHPELKVQVKWDAKARKVRVQVNQAPKGEPWALPLDVVLVVKGKSVTHTLQVEDKEHVFLLPAAEEPTQVLVDPRRDALCTLEVDKAPALWREELAHGAAMRARIEAALALGKDGSRASVDALAKALKDEKLFWGVRAACAKALGAAKTPAAKEALLAATKVKHPRARRGVARALGTFVEDAAVGEALLAWAKAGDPSVFVEADVARSLGRVRAKGALKALLEVGKRPSFMDHVLQGALDGLAALQDPGGWDFAVQHLRYGMPTFGRRAALMAVAKLAEVAQRKTEAVHLLTQALRDREFRVQLGAFDAAVALADRRMLGPLGAVGPTDPRVHRASREASRALREETPLKGELAALRADLEKVQLELRALKETAAPVKKKKA